MAQHTNVEIDYNGRVVELDQSLIIENKCQLRDSVNNIVTEYFIFNANNIESATITYDTGSDDEDWDSGVSIDIVSLSGMNRTYAIEVSAPYNDSLSESARTIFVSGTMYVTKDFGPSASCNLSFTVINSSFISKIQYKLDENSGDGRLFMDFFEKNIGYFSNSDFESRIYRTVSRYNNDNYSIDDDFDTYSLLSDTDLSLVSLKSIYRIQGYDGEVYSSIPRYKRIIDKANSYNIGTGLRTYGNSLITDIESNYNYNTHEGTLSFSSPLHAIGYKAFSFCVHEHPSGTTIPSYFSGINADYLTFNDCKVGPSNENRYSGETTESEFISNDINMNISYLLKEITLPEEVRIIGNQAFKYCKSLDKVTFTGQNLKAIGMFAFEGCEKLSAITIPNSVKQIGEGAFKRSGLKTFKAPRDLEMIEAGTFRGCKNLESIDLSDSSIKKIGQMAFEYCGSPSGYTLIFNDVLESIEGKVFEGESLRKSIDNQITVINNNILFPSSLCYIGENAFKWCSIPWVMWYNSEVYGDLIIKEGAFSYTTVGALELPAGFSGVGKDAFNHFTCNSLKFSGVSCPDPIGGARSFFDNCLINSKIFMSQAFYDDMQQAILNNNYFAIELNNLIAPDNSNLEII